MAKPEGAGAAAGKAGTKRPAEAAKGGKAGAKKGKAAAGKPRR